MATFVPYKNYFYNQFHGMASLVVTAVGKEQSPPGFVHGPEVRPVYSLHFCLKGKGTLRTSNKTHHVGVGDLLLICPNIKVYPKADRQDPWELSWVGFVGSDARLLTDALGLSSLNPVAHTSERSWPKIEKLFEEIYANRGDRPSHIVAMTGALYTCIAYLMEQSCNSFAQAPGFEYIEAALQFIADNYSKKITVDEIAQAAGVSRSCLYRAFMANLSTSVQEYVTEYRVRASCTLLEQGDLGLKEVAYRCGFANALYYSQVFKRVMGVPPTRYRAHLST